MCHSGLLVRDRQKKNPRPFKDVGSLIRIAVTVDEALPRPGCALASRSADVPLRLLPHWGRPLGALALRSQFLPRLPNVCPGRWAWRAG